MTDQLEQQPSQPEDVPEPPRPYTPKVKARAAREPSVRFCWIVAALIALSWIYATYTGFKAWYDETRMIEHGARVQAIGFGEGAKITGRPLKIGDTITVDYEHEGKKHTEPGVLVRVPDRKYTAGEPFEIRVDPANPSRWTNKEVPPGLRENMVASILLGFFALMALLAGLFLRQMYLWLWRNGEVVPGRVMEHKQSALAPKSIAVVCAVRHGRSDRPVTVFLPQEEHLPEGATIPVITNASGTRAIALDAYHP